MTIKTLDPKSALIVIDLQKGILALAATAPVDDVLKHAASLADAFREKHLPVVLVNVDGVAQGRAEQSRRLENLPEGWAELVPELKQQPSDHAVTKRTWGAFTNTDLESYLKAQGVTQVVVCGVATSAGVESTARNAHELGFNVTLATDAMTDMNPQAHRNSLANIFPRIGETGTTDEIIALLNKAGQ